MVSFKLFKLDAPISIGGVIQPSQFSKLHAKETDPSVVQTFIEKVKKEHRNFSSQNLMPVMMKVQYEQQLQFADNQAIWIPGECLLLQEKEYIFVQKTEKKLEFFLKNYISSKHTINEAFFDLKGLSKYWNNLKNNKESRLHRIILQKTSLDSDPIEEINLQAKDVEDIAIVSELIKEAKKIKVITVKLKFEEWITVRIDNNGSFLIYGKHSNDLLVSIASFLIKQIAGIR